MDEDKYRAEICLITRELCADYDCSECEIAHGWRERKQEDIEDAEKALLYRFTGEIY